MERDDGAGRAGGEYLSLLLLIKQRCKARDSPKPIIWLRMRQGMHNSAQSPKSQNAVQKITDFELRGARFFVHTTAEFLLSSGVTVIHFHFRPFIKL